MAEPFQWIRIGDIDGFGFSPTRGLSRPIPGVGPGPADTNDNGLLEPDEYLPDLRLFGTGNISLFGMPLGRAGLLLDYSNPLAPSLAFGIAAPAPGSPLQFLLPAQAEFGVLLTEPDERYLRLAASVSREGDGPAPATGRLLEIDRYPEVREALHTREPVLVVRDGRGASALGAAGRDALPGDAAAARAGLFGRT